MPRTNEEISAEVLGTWTVQSNTSDLEANDDSDDSADSDSTQEEIDNVTTGDSTLPAEESATDMSLNTGDVSGGGDFGGVGGGGGGEGDTVDSALQEVEEAANNIASGSNDHQIVEVRRKLRSLRVKMCCCSNTYTTCMKFLSKWLGEPFLLFA